MDDPYRTLGLGHGALSYDVRRAYREKVKLLHPDVAGDEDSFAELKAAHDLLLDPARREHFDLTGKILPDLADNGHAPMMEILSTAYVQVMSALAADGLDPSNGDMVAAMTTAVTNMRDQIQKQLDEAEKGAAFVRKTEGRFGEPEDAGRIAGIVSSQVAGVVQQAAIARTRLKGIEDALGYLALCWYRKGP